MRTVFFAVAMFPLVGCASQSSFVHSDTTLGRVVVYRNGIAYFERTAVVAGDTLRLSVPADKVDDFLKSLTVVDAKTGEPAPISYPTSASLQKDAQAQKEAQDSGLISMNITLPGASPHSLKLTYVTEAPSWKPSYRIVLGKDGKLNVQAWAIVDNTSGEDWKNVQLGVGSSSALSFRFDLRSVRLVTRETLRTDDLFAQAPPMGGATYQQLPGNGFGNNKGQQRVMAELSDDTLAQVDKPVPADETRGSGKKVKDAERYRNPPAPGGKGAGHAASRDPAPKPAEPAQAQAQTAIDRMANALKGNSSQVVIQGFADAKDGDKNAASLERANKAREQLVRRGVDPSRVVAIGAGEQTGHAAGVSIVEADGAMAAQSQTAQNGDLSGVAGGLVGGVNGAITTPKAPAGTDPIGTSHFESQVRMSVARGTSAMVSILSTETEGEVVYFYDAETARGNSQFPFRAVRLKNPTDSALESGPVTVFGEGKFIGEGMSEPIPAHSNAFVPFALDRQIVVERKDGEQDQIARVITVQRGVFSTEVQHIRKATFTLNNRLSERATVYLRHTVAEGYKLVKPPKDMERLGTAYLVKVTIEPGSKTDVTLEEATPLFKSTDIRTSQGMELVSAYLSSAALDGPLKGAVAELLKLQKEMANTEQKISTMREQMNEYRARMDELHAQLVTLKLVKSAGPLIANLEKKLIEVSDKLSKETIDLVAQQEKLMVARIKFQDGVADLSLEKKEEPPKG